MTQPSMETGTESAWDAPPPARSWGDGVRYGASLVATLLGVYLVATTSFAQFVQTTIISNGPGIEYSILLLSRYAFAFVVLAAAFAIAPTSIARRLGMAGLVALVGILLAVFTTLRLTGQLPGGGPVWTVALNPLFIALLVGTAGWLTVRERPALSYLLLIPTVLVGLLPLWLIMARIPVPATELLTMPLALVLGVGIAWIARAIDRATRR